MREKYVRLLLAVVFMLAGYSEMALANSSVDAEAWKLYLRGECGLAVDRLRPAAEGGHVPSMLLIAECSESGKGMVREPQAALGWRRRAAESGDVASQFALGNIYVRGEGVAAIDKAEAVRWYRRAAEAGHPNAQLALARALQNGEGVARNESEAVKWLSRAAETGLAEAQSALAEAYEQGRGVKQDAATGQLWRQLVRKQAENAALAEKAAAEERKRLELEARMQAMRRQMDDWYWSQPRYCHPYWGCRSYPW